MTNIDRMPCLTFNMLIDAIYPYEILYKPENAEKRTYKWISSIHWERGSIREKDVVIACKAKAAREAMSLFPDSLLVVFVDQGKESTPPQAFSKSLKTARRRRLSSPHLRRAMCSKRFKTDFLKFRTGKAA